MTVTNLQDCRSDNTSSLKVLEEPSVPIIISTLSDISVLKYPLITTMLPILLCFFRILVELTGITNACFDRWNVWRIDIFLSQPFPGYLGKPLMILNVF